MSVHLRPTCPLGVSDEILSALRDEALPAGDLRRLNEHAAICPACALRLEGYERLGRLLRDQRLPGPAPALWDDVRGSILARRSLPVRSQWRTVVSPRLGALGAVAAVLLVALLFGFVLHALPNGATTLATPTASAAITDTPPPTAALTWHQVTLPRGVNLQNARLAVSPVEGRDAWICSPSDTGSFVIWATQDGAATWQQVGTFSPSPPVPPSTCAVIADQTDPRSLALVISWGSGEAGTLVSMAYYSTDGGAHWRPVSNALGLNEISTVLGTTYAILRPAMASQGAPWLVISSNGQHSWREIRPTALPSNDGFFRFWVKPSGDQLFAATYNDTLWESDNEGVSWSQVSTPNQQTSLGTWLPQANQWMFCGWAGGSTIDLQCSDDSGKTWRSQPTFDTTTSCASCGKNGAPYSSTQVCYPSAMAADGSLIANCPATGSAPDQGQFTTYRLAPGASAWRSLGPAPAFDVATSNNGELPATGELWSVDARGILYMATLPS
jgi:photosystem II stability/assembly factor-like uncharacterized protein